MLWYPLECVLGDLLLSFGKLYSLAGLLVLDLDLLGGEKTLHCREYLTEEEDARDMVGGGGEAEGVLSTQ